MEDKQFSNSYDEFDENMLNSDTDLSIGTICVLILASITCIAIDIYCNINND